MEVLASMTARLSTSISLPYGFRRNQKTEGFCIQRQRLASKKIVLKNHVRIALPLSHVDNMNLLHAFKRLSHKEYYRSFSACDANLRIFQPPSQHLEIVKIHTRQRNLPPPSAKSNQYITDQLLPPESQPPDTILASPTLHPQTEHPERRIFFSPIEDSTSQQNTSIRWP